MSVASPAHPPRARRVRLLIVGVGGQGILTLAQVLGDAAVAQELPVVISQLHGLSQRGGSVEASVVLGPGLSSFVETGSADVVLALEPLEALRARPRMSEATRVIVSVGPIVPHVLSQSGRSYPDVDGILADLRAVAGQVIAVDGPALLAAHGETRALNALMLGALAEAAALPLSAEAVWAAVERRTSSKYIEANRRAFELGREAAKS